MSFVKIVLVAFSVAFLATVNAENVDLPAGVKTCKKDSDDYSSCLRLAIQEAWPIFVKGVPELNVPILDPFYIEYQVNDYKVGEVVAKVVSKNVNMYGLADLRFYSVKPRHEDNRFSLEIDYELPKALMEGAFKADGKIGTFKVGGKGDFNMTMEEVRAIWKIEGPVVNDKWIIETVNVTPEVGKMKIWASDLFNGNEQLTKAALAFVNEYWPVLYREMLPYAAETWNSYLRDFLNNVFSKLSFSKTFP